MSRWIEFQVKGRKSVIVVLPSQQLRCSCSQFRKHSAGLKLVWDFPLAIGRSRGLFLSLISLHIIWPHHSLYHFIWTECIVIGHEPSVFFKSGSQEAALIQKHAFI